MARNRWTSSLSIFSGHSLPLGEVTAGDMRLVTDEPVVRGMEVVRFVGVEGEAARVTEVKVKKGSLISRCVTNLIS